MLTNTRWNFHLFIFSSFRYQSNSRFQTYLSLICLCLKFLGGNIRYLHENNEREARIDQFLLPLLSLLNRGKVLNTQSPYHIGKL